MRTWAVAAAGASAAVAAALWLQHRQQQQQQQHSGSFLSSFVSSISQIRPFDTSAGWDRVAMQLLFVALAASMLVSLARNWLDMAAQRRRQPRRPEDLNRIADEMARKRQEQQERLKAEAAARAKEAEAAAAAAKKAKEEAAAAAAAAEAAAAAARRPGGASAAVSFDAIRRVREAQQAQAAGATAAAGSRPAPPHPSPAPRQPAAVPSSASRFQSSREGPIFPGDELKGWISPASQEAARERARQDAELAASLEHDRLKEERRLEKERAREEAERLEREREEAERERRALLLSRVPPEPAAEAEGRVTVAVRLPNSQTKKRCWLREHTVDDLYCWVESLEEFPALRPTQKLQLCIPFPKQVVVREEGEGMTLADADLVSNVLLVVEVNESN